MGPVQGRQSCSDLQVGIRWQIPVDIGKLQRVVVNRSTICSRKLKHSVYHLPRVTSHILERDRRFQVDSRGSVASALHIGAICRHAWRERGCRCWKFGCISRRRWYWTNTVGSWSASPIHFHSIKRPAVPLRHPIIGLAFRMAHWKVEAWR